MNSTLMWATFRKTHWIRFSMLSVFFLLGFFNFTSSKSIMQGEMGAWFVWILGAGVIGKDTADGVMHLIFSRPIKRSEYVFSKWFVVGLMATVVTFIYLGMGWMILWHNNLTPPWQEFLTSLGYGILICFGASSTLVFLSSVVPGLGDLALMFLFLLTGGLAEWLLGDYVWKQIIWFFKNVNIFIFPAMEWSQMDWDDHSLSDWISYFALVTTWLSMTIFVLNRKEISYANS